MFLEKVNKSTQVSSVNKEIKKIHNGRYFKNYKH